MKLQRSSRPDARLFSSTIRCCCAIRQRRKRGGCKRSNVASQGSKDRATFVVHICCGYPNKPLERKGIAYKANQDYYGDILTWLSESKLDVVSIEGAASKLDVSILSAIGKKTVMLGVVDVGENEVESVESLVARANEALRYIPKGQLILAPDCGMLELTHASARKKLMNLSLAARDESTSREVRHL